MKNVAIIPARSGSKRVPGKNIRNLMGQPMISWPISTAIKSNLFDHVIVTTDSKEVAEISKSWGAEVPFLRPIDLADDHTGTFPVIKHAISKLHEIGISTNNICCIYPTAPMIKIKDLKDSFLNLNKLNANFIMGVCEYNHPIVRALSFSNDCNIEMINKENSNIRTQDLSPCFYDAGQFYWGNANSWMKYENIFEGLVSPFILPSSRAVDIDNESDWKFAEILFKSQNG